ncbi:putative Peptidase M48 [Vibrio nigripulchritudo MADA3029]|uniref:M48 family metallopeptidase n=1 Tax=Vibrio nigripulchritudo TaxID=28173 RepID=UPI0003B21D9E|nr:M48 family metallopeptidase [Vibrio nigripulchritudo]CCN50074.1 putative Peptidase M48 [Vibrio nigripulchritudo MADA3020]CCN54350.1 putative Peptidase M48 [Vibrio nigripulchritudo MADA3021]CCN58948.1 putative Peptidase M48 [Vibrio nigripulchritudo MADA3029]
MSIKRTLVTGLTATLLVSCTTSPTGRDQLLLFSANDMANLGANSFEQMKQREKVSNDSKTNAYVRCVTDSITKHVPKQSSFDRWEVVVFDSDQINAFALPGGKIGVYTGLLKVAKNQDQLATVIGHEIAHVLADHGNERLSSSQLANVGLQITNVSLQNSEYQGLAMGVLGVGVQYGVLMPYGRSQESEADILGLDLMAKAGFDPRQSVELWKNMAKASKGKNPPELLSTHPSHNTRITNLSNRFSALPAPASTRPNCG